MNKLIRAALAFGGVAMLATMASATDPRAMTKVTSAQASRLPATANRAVPGVAIKAALNGGQTGLFRVSSTRLSGNGTVETLAVVENGRVVDLHSRKSGVFLPRRSSGGIRALSAATYRTLIGYGIDVPVTQAARRTAFLAAARGTSSGGTTAPSNSTPSTPCPADFAQASPARQQLLLRNPAYASCLLTSREPFAPARLAARGFTELFGIPAASAADWSMIFFECGTDPFFSNWGFEYVPDEYVAVNIGGARGVWANTGG